MCNKIRIQALDARADPNKRRCNSTLILKFKVKFTWIFDSSSRRSHTISQSCFNSCSGKYLHSWKNIIKKIKQCCGFGMFIPDPGSNNSTKRGGKNCFLCTIFKKVWWPYATLFCIYFSLYNTVDTFIHHSFINIRWGPSPFFVASKIIKFVKKIFLNRYPNEYFFKTIH